VVLLLFSLPIFANAQAVVPLNSSGAETVTKSNAESLGFSVEVTNVGELVRFRVVLPDLIHNGFKYAYTSAQMDRSDGKSMLVFRPETQIDTLSKSKSVVLVAPANVLPCLRVAAIYLNPDRPMHSDYYMSIDVRSFLGGDSELCELDRSRSAQ
jgi:hypothetical protein